MATICDRWLWRLSRYDDRVHAFEQVGDEATFAEAVCSHSVPLDRLVARYDGVRCVACLLIVGDYLAEYHRSDVGF